MSLKEYFYKYKFLFKKLNIFEYQDLLQEFYLLQTITKKNLKIDLFIKGLLKKCFTKRKNDIQEIDIDDFSSGERDKLLNQYYSIWQQDRNYE